MSKIQAVEMGKYIEEYLSMRDISLIVLLLDIRHKPTEDDKLMYSYILKKNIPFLIICNKADKIAKTKVKEYVEDLIDVEELCAKYNLKISVKRL
mgnify:CR=1 FL=1